MTLTKTEVLGRYVHDLRLEDVPEDVTRFASVVLTDTVGVLVGASRSKTVQLLIRSLLADRQGTQASVVGAAAMTSAETAAFVNGAGAHTIELDDSHGPSRTHAASVLVPAALAVGELADASVDDLLLALIAGYDVQARISKAMGVQSIFARGFHPSAVCGSIGAAAVGASLLGLSAETTTIALGLAASQSSGLLTFEEDSTHMVKSLQTGVAARNGVFAALLAAAGYQASNDTLDGPHNAVHAFGGDVADLELLDRELGSKYEIVGTSIKRHACCGQTHAAVDGVLDILESTAIEPGEITSIEVELAHPAVPIVDGNALWTHNIQYVLALAAYERAITEDHFTDEWTSAPQIRELSKRVTVSGSDELDTRFPAAKGANVTVRANGATEHRHVEAPVGHPGRPLTPDVIAGKFRTLVGPSLGESRVDELFEIVQRGTASVRDLTSMLRSLDTAIAEQAPAIA